VGREGVESAVFTLAIVFSTTAASALGGAAIGLAGGLAIAFVIYRLGHRLNLSRFFTVVGVLLMVFAAALVANTVQNLQHLGWLPVLTTPLWQSGRILAEDSAFGDVLHSLFGYSQAPTPLQLIAYVGYLAVVIALFLWLRPGRARRQQRSPSGPAPASTGGGPPGPAGSADVSLPGRVR
jgi:high-affinity iron transporter